MYVCCFVTNLLVAPDFFDENAETWLLY